ncbi:type II toxin-antitoxin system Phd/YefM family antitoxin [bacterium]|nr:type II toxin-antitoxin system Phd/YefM family antitoxin [bacterium]MBU1957138.1 type II toxin-antitoxin system Phd/YefM family antitoxin [bacterium]
MTQILANYTTSISELKKSPSSVIENAAGEAVAILNHNKPSAYILSPEMFEHLLEMAEENMFLKEVAKRYGDRENVVDVTLDEL